MTISGLIHLSAKGANPTGIRRRGVPNFHLFSQKMKSHLLLTAFTGIILVSFVHPTQKSCGAQRGGPFFRNDRPNYRIDYYK